MRPKLVDHLPAGAAGHRRPGRGRINDDRLERALARCDGGEDGGALGAVAKAVGGVFNVAAGVDFARAGEHGRAHAELGVGRVADLGGGARGFFEGPHSHGGNLGRRVQRCSPFHVGKRMNGKLQISAAILRRASCASRERVGRSAPRIFAAQGHESSERQCHESKRAGHLGDGRGRWCGKHRKEVRPGRIHAPQCEGQRQATQKGLAKSKFHGVGRAEIEGRLITGPAIASPVP